MRTTIFILSMLFVLLTASPAHACLCGGTTVRKSFKEASAIFTGKFLRSEYRKGIKSQFEEMNAGYTGKKLDYEVLVYVFEADKWWKGAGTREVVLISDETRRSDGTGSVSDCGLGFEKGVDYLIYAYGKGDDFGTGACTLTKRVARAQKDISLLGRLARPVAAK
jgi:hypothetical protein